MSDVAQARPGRGAARGAAARPALRQRGRRPRARPALQPPARPTTRSSSTRGRRSRARRRRGRSRRSCGSTAREQAVRARGARAASSCPTTRRAARRAAASRSSKIGMPYIWGGETDAAGRGSAGRRTAAMTARGFVWRVFKLGGLPAGARIHGRTAAAMAARSPLAAAAASTRSQPGDLVFFGSARFWQRATRGEHDVHDGIALGNGWMINAVRPGRTVAPLCEDWRVKRFSLGATGSEPASPAAALVPPALVLAQPRRVAQAAELGGVAAEEQADVPVDQQAQLALDARHHRQVVGARQPPRGRAAPLDAERAARRPRRGPCRRTRRASCSGTA